MWLLPSFGALSRVPGGMLTWCGAGGNKDISWQRPELAAGVRWVEHMGGPVRAKWKRQNEEERKPRRKEAK